MDSVRSVNLSVLASPVVNFVIHQNKYPVIKQLVIENQTDTDLTGLLLKIEFVPGFARPFTLPVDLVPARTNLA